MPLKTIIDIALVAIIVLFSIIGLVKGFFRTFLSFFGTVASLFISIWLARPVAEALLKIGFVNKIFGHEGTIYNAIAKRFADFAAMGTNIIYMLVVTSLMFAVLKVFLSLLGRLFNRLVKNKVIRGFNRFFGFIFGALQGVVIVALILVVGTLLSKMKFMAPYNEALDETAIAKPFNNVVSRFVEKNINLDKLLKDNFPGVETPETETPSETPSGEPE